MVFLLHNLRQLRRAYCTNANKNADADKMRRDIELLVYLSGFKQFVVAKNGLSYWYYFATSEVHLDTVQYIMESNGIYPLRHFSEMYCRDKVALRVPQFFINRDANTQKFIDAVTNMSYKNIDVKSVTKYLDAVEQQMNQKVR